MMENQERQLETQEKVIQERKCNHSALCDHTVNSIYKIITE